MLRFYSDETATSQMSPAEYFIGNGLFTQFTLTKFGVSDMSALYVENIVDVAGVVFTNGLSSGATIVGTDYIGYAVYHQYDNSTEEGAGLPCIFRGYVRAGVGTTATTIQLDADYTASSDKLRLVKYVKKTLGVDYTITEPYTISMIAGAPANGAKIYALGPAPLSINFGGGSSGIAGDLITSSKLVYIKADDGYAYDTVQIYSDNLTQKLQITSVSGVDITNGESTNGVCDFPAVNSEKGKAVNVNGVYIGIITSNTVADFTCAYGTDMTTPAANAFDATAAEVSIYTVGEFALARDILGTPGAYRKVLQNYLGNPDGFATEFTPADVIGIWISAVVPLPENAMNYTESVLRIAATEYLE